MAKPSRKRNDKAVKIERDLATKAKVIAESRGTSVAEYLSGLLRSPIEKDWPKAIRDIDASRPKSPPDATDN